MLSGRDRDHVTVVREVDAPRLLEEGGGVRGQERLTLADPDDERRLAPSADEQVGMIGVNGDEREVALHLPVRLADSLDEVAVVVALDQVGNGLGVGLGGKRVTLALEAGLELAVVLNDAVQDDGELVVVTAGQRMRVCLRDGAVRRPARVSETRDRTGLPAAGLRLQLVERTDGAGVLEVAVGEERNTGRVVAPVLEAREAGEQERLTRPVADVPDDPAHSGLLHHVGVMHPRNTTSPAWPPAAPPTINRAPC